MKYRTLGHGLKVSAIGIGCMTMTKGNINYGADADEEESERTIHRAIELGVTLFDTAQIYGPFRNEEFLGRAIKGKRDGLVIATKFGFRFGPTGIEGVDGSPANAKKVVEESLQRLGIDCIDLFYQHRVDPIGSDRGHGWGNGGLGQGRQNPPYRTVRSRRANLGTRRKGRPDQRVAIRIFAVGARC